MATEAIVFDIMRKSNAGVKFTTTISEIGSTLVERSYFENIEGKGMLDRLLTIMQKYFDFDLRLGVKEYRENRSDFVSYVGKIEQDGTPRKRTWLKIMNIMDLLEADACRFLDISVSEKVQ